MVWAQLVQCIPLIGICFFFFAATWCSPVMYL
jgi:hypothetical protein